MTKIISPWRIACYTIIFILSILLFITLHAFRMEVAKNKSLIQKQNTYQIEANTNWDKYFEVANRLADLQFKIGEPQSIDYTLPYGEKDRFLFGNKMEPVMYPQLYTTEYGTAQVLRCNYTGIVASADLVKSCNDHLTAIFNAWNP